MTLKQRAEALGVLPGWIKIKHDAVRIANSSGAKEYFPAPDFNFLVEHLAFLPCDRYGATREANPPHIDCNQPTCIGHEARNISSSRTHREESVGNEPSIPEVPGEYPQSVTALLRLRAIWVVDTEPKGAIAAPRLMQQYAIRSDPEVPVADALDHRFRERLGELCRLHYEVVVSKGVVAGEFHRWDSIRALSTLPPAEGEFHSGVFEVRMPWMEELGRTSGESSEERYESALCGLYEAGTCRSCGLLGLSAGRRASSKTASVLEVLHSAGVAPSHIEPLLLPATPWSSRAKIKVIVSGTAAAPVIGIVRSGLHAVELAACPLSPAPFRALLEYIRTMTSRCSLIPYDIETRRGELKGLIVMSDSSHSEGILRFVLRSTESVPRIRKAIPALIAAHPWIKVVSCNIQPLPAALLEGQEEIILTEATQISAQYGTVRLFFSPQSFMQVTPEVAAALYAKARAWGEEIRPGRLLDLFCGVGGFSLALAPVCDSILGVEISEMAVKSASLAAEQLGFGEKVRFVAGDAERVLVEQAGSRFDTVVVNPPRRGLSPELIRLITETQPQHIIYSSCNPETFARDVAAWQGRYTLVRVALFDMFPLTKHCELLGLLAPA